MKSIIKVEQPAFQKDTEQSRHDFAVITGRAIPLKPATFRDMTTDQYYCHIVGGIAFPTAFLPGIVIIIGIQSTPRLLFRVLEVVEESNVFHLIAHMVALRQRYGFGEDRRILPYFLGDQEKFKTLIMKSSEMLEAKHGVDRGLYIKDTVDLRDKHAFPLYSRQIFNVLKTNTLDINNKLILTGHLQDFNRDEAETGRVDQFPAVGLLGGMIHTLQIERLWLEDLIKSEAFNMAV